MNLPNALTALRFVLIAVFVYFFLTGQLLIALIVFVLAGVTDILDGYIARKYDLITDTGKLLDPLADKLMLLAALICMYTKNMVPLIVIIVVLAKEVIMILGGIFLYKHDIVVFSNIFGKIGTFIFDLGIGLSFLNQIIGPYPTLETIYSIVLYVAVAIAIIAFIQYAIPNVKNFFNKKNNESEKAEDN